MRVVFILKVKVLIKIWADVTNFVAGKNDFNIVTVVKVDLNVWDLIVETKHFNSLGCFEKEKVLAKAR